MTWKVYDATERFVGTISSDKGNDIVVGADCAEILRSRVEQALKGGISRMKETYDLEQKIRFISEEPVPSGDPHLALAFKKFLERQGYAVIEEHPEAIKELKDLLDKLPESEAKKSLLGQIPQMSYLELTFAIRSIKGMVEKRP